MRPITAKCATLLLALPGCALAVPSYHVDADFLSAHTEVVEIASGTGSFLVCPAWGGRVASAAIEAGGKGFGHLPRGALADATALPSWGGAEACHFDADSAAAYAVVERHDRGVVLERVVAPRSGFQESFPTRVRREIVAPDAAEVAAAVGWPGTELPGPWTAFRSRTTVEQGDAPQRPADADPLRLCISGAFRCSARAWVVLPLRRVPPVQHEAVLGEVGPCIEPPAGVRFGADFALFRAAAHPPIGMDFIPEFATDRLACWDEHARVLTLVKFGPLDRAERADTEIVSFARAGGAARSCVLGTTAPALALASGAALLHERLTVHLRLERDEDLDEVLRWGLRVDPAEFRRLAGLPRSDLQPTASPDR